MKIYTKQGDKGTSAVYTSTMIRVDKDDALLDCYGTLDELNSYIGLLVALTEKFDKSDEANASTALFLQSIQKDIFDIGFALSDSDKLSQASVNKLEKEIDGMQQALPPQNNFILPGGSEIAAHAHVARTIARRAERSLVVVAKQHEVNDVALAYINRLSDYLFVFARFMNNATGKADITV